KVFFKLENGYQDIRVKEEALTALTGKKGLKPTLKKGYGQARLDETDIAQLRKNSSSFKEPKDKFIMFNFAKEKPSKIETLRSVTAQAIIRIAIPKLIEQAIVFGQSSKSLRILYERHVEEQKDQTKKAFRWHDHISPGLIQEFIDYIVKKKTKDAWT